MGPVRSWKDKGLQISQWQTNNGGQSFTITKRYKDKNSGEWKDSKTYFKEDIERLGILIQTAITELAMRDEHANEGIPSGQGKGNGGAVQYEFDDMDDIPF